jgi:hypothetical protein
LKSIKPYEIQHEDENFTTIKLWNQKKSETWHNKLISKERLIHGATQSYQNSLAQAKVNAERFNNIKIGQIVSYIIGYNCTLYQFAVVVKKTSKTIVFQKFEYQGMSQIAKPTILIDGFFKVQMHNLGQYSDYNASRIYENNED